MQKTFIKQLPIYVLTAVIFAAVIAAGIFLSGGGGENPDLLTVSPRISGGLDATPLPQDTAAPGVTATAEAFPTERLAKRVYELSYYFGVQSFTSAEEISPSALAQYAFCHLFAESLVDESPGDQLVYRQAVESSILDEIHRQFVIVDFDAKKSDLYNSEKHIFEMWQPDYSAEVYYDASVEALADDRYRMTVTFFTNEAKTIAEKEFTVVFQKQQEQYLFKSMQKR